MRVVACSGYFDFKLGATLGLLRLEMKVILTSSTRTWSRGQKCPSTIRPNMAHCLRYIQRVRFNTNLWCFRILFLQLILLINPIFNFFALTLIFEFNFKFQGRWPWDQLDCESVGEYMICHFMMKIPIIEFLILEGVSKYLFLEIHI